MAKNTSVGRVEDLRHTPMYFVDQPAAIMLGSDVSRLIFGVDDGDDAEYPRPVVTLAMTTRSLKRLVSELQAALDDPVFRRRSAAALHQAAEDMQSGTSTRVLTLKKSVEISEGDARRKLTSVKGKQKPTA